MEARALALCVARLMPLCAGYRPIETGVGDEVDKFEAYYKSIRSFGPWLNAPIIIEGSSTN